VVDVQTGGFCSFRRDYLPVQIADLGLETADSLLSVRYATRHLQSTHIFACTYGALENGESFRCERNTK
jgi:hypothetical protein